MHVNKGIRLRHSEPSGHGLGVLAHSSMSVGEIFMT